MSKLQGKIDFTLFISVKNANPNGDPLNGNRPRTDIDGYGEISDVCIKRKIRNRMQDLGERIFVQSDERSDGGFKSLKERADGCEVLKKEIAKKNNIEVMDYSSKEYEDYYMYDAMHLGWRGWIDFERDLYKLKK